MIVNPAERIVTARTKAIEILHLKMTKNPEKSDKIFHLIMQIEHINAGFCCKFFDFNWHLVFKFASACVMYLTIIIQFEGSFESCNVINSTLSELL